MRRDRVVSAVCLSALVVLVVLMLYGGLLLFKMTRELSSTTSAVGEARRELETVSGRVALLEKRLRHELATGDRRSVRNDLEHEIEDVDPSWNALRLDELERQIDGLAEHLEALSLDRAPLRSTTSPETEETLSVAMDASRAVEERARALQTLRFSDTEAWAFALVEMFQEPELSARFVRSIGALRSQRLKAPLIELARGHSDAEIREEAVESLQRFFDDPAVRRVVQAALDFDPSPEVRREAASVLEDYAKHQSQLDSGDE